MAWEFFEINAKEILAFWQIMLFTIAHMIITLPWKHRVLFAPTQCPHLAARNREAVVTRAKKIVLICFFSVGVSFEKKSAKSLHFYGYYFNQYFLQIVVAMFANRKDDRGGYTLCGSACFGIQVQKLLPVPPAYISNNGCIRLLLTSCLPLSFSLVREFSFFLYGDAPNSFPYLREQVESFEMYICRLRFSGFSYRLREDHLLARWRAQNVVESSKVFLPKMYAKRHAFLWAHFILQVFASQRQRIREKKHSIFKGPSSRLIARVRPGASTLFHIQTPHIDALSLAVVFSRFSSHSHSPSFKNQA